jgi:hypothetical protein
MDRHDGSCANLKENFENCQVEENIVGYLAEDEVLIIQSTNLRRMLLFQSNTCRLVEFLCFVKNLIS